MADYLIGLGKNDSQTRKSADEDFIAFWAEQASNLSWFERWHDTLQWDPPFGRWFVGGKLNASYNTLDRIIQKTPAKTAILWEGEDGQSRTITYDELWVQVNKFSNVLKSLGVQKGDRITIYLPMVPELLVSMLACARIGAVHSVIFSGFSSKSIKDRVEDSGSKIVITADGGFRRGTVIKLKEIVDEAIAGLDFVQSVIVLERAKIPITISPKDKKWSVLMK